MACLLFNQSVTAACRDAQPGVSLIYIANYADITTVSENAGGTLVTGITGTTASGETSGYFYTVAVNKESSGFVDNSEISIPDGRSLYIPTLTMRVSNMDTTTRTIFKELSQATVMVIFKTIDGLYYLAGKDNGLDMSAGTFSTGVARGDFKGLELTLEGLESEPVIQIDPEEVTTQLSTWLVA
jgi:hypothetical protein